METELKSIVVEGKHYEIIKELSYKGCHPIKKVRNCENNEIFVCKSEPKKSIIRSQFQLKNEYEIYKYIHKDGKANQNGIPLIFGFESNEIGDIMIMQELGLSIKKVFEMSKHKFSLKSVVKLAIQMISLLEYVHSLGLIHRDLSPDNFVFGANEEWNKLYLIDFGLSHSYLKDNVSGEHIPFKEGVGFCGTPRFAGKWSLAGLEQCRREDLESLSYILIYLLKGALPWDEKLQSCDFYDLACIKGHTKSNELIGESPKEFQTLLEHSLNLCFKVKPDYNYLKTLFHELFLKCGFIEDDDYEWNPKYINEI